ncbi:hypothetical protein PV416_38105 [Streptomyces ipomoeae]|nr:hypothetical protein [Streptomyces ipomoeae]MDX2826731.1 hypothetical protein [Streptomyces ipomoeae]MDX2879641.1 hypothetical protein [Streptomyces ipomoeae]
MITQIRHGAQIKQVSHDVVTAGGPAGLVLALGCVLKVLVTATR